MKRALLAVAIGLALSAAPAQAAPFTPYLHLTYKLAVKYWGGYPPNCLGVDKQVVPMGSLDNLGGDGKAAVTRATQPDYSRNCVLYVDRRLALLANLGETCRAMLHEVGHLYGYSHNANPTSIMYEHGGWAAPLPLCERVRTAAEDLWVTRSFYRESQRECRRSPSRKCWHEARLLRRELRRATKRFWSLANS